MLIKSSSKLQFIWPVGVFHRIAISMGWLNQVAVEMGTEQRACCLVFDTHLKGPVLPFCSCACGGLQLPAYFWGVLIASSLPPGKTPTPALPPLFLSSSPLLLLISFLFCTDCSCSLRSSVCFSIPSAPSGQQVWVEVYCGDQSW